MAGHDSSSDGSHLSWKLVERPSVLLFGALVTALVFASGLVGVWMTEGEHLGPAACVYATLRLFVFHGEPTWLSHHNDGWGFVAVAAFAGPALTAAFVAILIRQVVRFIRDRQWITAERHVVILGCGREGVRWARFFRAADSAPIVLIDRSDQGEYQSGAREVGATIMAADMQDATSWRRAAIAKSRVVVVTTGNEIANISTARAIEQHTGPNGPRIFCRVVSQALLFSMKRTARKTASRIRYFNVYDFVAQDTLAAAVSAVAEDRTRPIHLIICGFGRFGQAVLHAASLLPDLPPRLAGIDVVDLKADELLGEYRFSAPDTDDAVLRGACARRSGILNPDLWDQLLALHPGATKLVYICTDNDVTNLVHALAIQRLLRKKAEGQAVLVTRQVENPQTGEPGILYASTAESTDEQIRRLVADTSMGAHVKT